MKTMSQKQNKNPNTNQKVKVKKESPSKEQSYLAPVARTKVMKGGGNPPNDSITITRREYIGDVSGSVTFAVNSYSDNPGLPASFPWLSTIAPNYEQYEVLSRSFCYEPESATSATGTVILSYDYDAVDSAPVDKPAALLVKDSVRVAPWAPCRLTLKTQDLNRRGKLYVRSGTIANTDLKTYDLGKLSVSTIGQAGTTVIGELWFEYTIRFHVAQQGSSPGVIITGAGSVSKTSVFGTSPTYSGNTPVTASGSVLTFSQPGYFLVAVLFTGTVMGSFSTTVTASTNSTVTLKSAVVDGGALNLLSLYHCRMVSGGTLTFDGSGATTVTASVADVATFFTSS